MAVACASLAGLLPLAGSSHVHFQDMGPGEWAVAVAAGLASLWSIWKCVRYAFAPGETEPDHVKRLILHDDPPAGPPAGGSR
ncbi:MAG: hypothetical protein ACKOSS_08295 [Planctomycetia bacterium]